LIDEGLNHANRVVLVHIVLKAFRQHADLVPVLAFDESLYAIVLARCVDKVYRETTFLHSLGQKADGQPFTYGRKDTSATPMSDLFRGGIP
jgi:hypothetical protein